MTDTKDNKDSPREYLEVGSVPANFKIAGEMAYKRALNNLNNVFDDLWGFYGFMRGRDNRALSEDGKYVNPESSYVLIRDMFDFLMEHFVQMAYSVEHNFDFGIDLAEMFVQHVKTNDKYMMKARDQAFKENANGIDEYEKMKDGVKWALKKAINRTIVDFGENNEKCSRLGY